MIITDEGRIKRVQLKDLEYDRLLIDFGIPQEDWPDLRDHMIRELITHETGDKGVVIFTSPDHVDLMTLAESLKERKSVVILNP